MNFTDRQTLKSVAYRDLAKWVGQKMSMHL